MRKNLICLLLLIFSEIIVYAQAEVGDGWDGTVAAKFAGGTGEALDPYLISNAAQLAKLATDVINGNTYMDRNEFKIRLENDRYINTTTVRRKIETNSGGSGGGSRGGSFHRGSGGRSFGGGGRKL